MTLAQLLPEAKFLIVTTPQPTAQKVARRAAEMAHKVDLEIAGVVENMAGFVTPGGERFPIFGEGGGQELADELDVPLLGKVPLTMPLREQADAGEPLVVTDPDDPAAQAIRQAARGLIALFPAELPILQVVRRGGLRSPSRPAAGGHQPADGRPDRGGGAGGAPGTDRQAAGSGVRAVDVPAHRVRHRAQTAPDEDHGDGEPREREERVDAQRVADAGDEVVARHARRGHDRGVEPEADRAARDLEHVDDPAGQAAREGRAPSRRRS